MLDNIFILQYFFRRQLTSKHINVWLEVRTRQFVCIVIMKPVSNFKTFLIDMW